jgi:DNA polymerase
MHVRGEGRSQCATIDFETRSACSLRACGAWRYSIDPTTEVLCLGFRLPFWDADCVELWHPAFPHLDVPESPLDPLVDLLSWVTQGRLVEAHNAWFERSIWTNILVPQYGAPPIDPAQWRDSAAKAAAHALPRSLDGVTAALGLDQTKDDIGHRLMMKVSKPRKPRKAEREAGVTRLLWWESRDLFEQLWAYCRQDVRAEAEVSETLPDLNEQETQLYVWDQIINERGFQLDQQAVRTALRLIALETKKLNGELCRLTLGCVPKASARRQLLQWLADEGVDLDNTQAQTVTETLQSRRLTPAARRGLEILQLLGKSSTAKYEAMRQWMASDGRVRGGVVYHGATTGRWTGAGVQPHNFPRGTIKDQDDLWRQLKQPIPQICVAGTRLDVMNALSQGLRGAIVAGPDQQLYVADYSAIEARVVMWLAGQEDALDIFRRGEDIYLDMASTIYDRVCSKEDIQERQLGKATILGCGYQMGAPKFVSTAATYGVQIDEDFSRQVVEAYRAKYHQVKSLWRDMEDAAIDALHEDNVEILIPCGRVTWHLEGRFLYCTLPSGRRLAYPDPRLTPRQTPWGETRFQLSYMGVDPRTHKWTRQVTYGGMLVENVTQAVARDIMAEAILRCEEQGRYRVILSVHDELIAEADRRTGSVEEFESLLTTLPEWADGLPIAAEGWVGTRYHK